MTGARFVLLIAALMALSALSGLAGQGPGGPPPGPPPGMPPGPPPIPPIIAALDANKDAKIDATEIANASAALLTLDKSGDGVLTRDEVCPMPMPPGGPMGGPGACCKLNSPPPEGARGRCPMGPGTGPGANCPGPPPPGMMCPGGPGGPGRCPMMPICAALDANADGTIDATEIMNAPAALLKLDKNGDGVLTLDEFAPPPPPMGGPRGGPGGPGGPGGRGARGRGH